MSFDRVVLHCEVLSEKWVFKLALCVMVQCLLRYTYVKCKMVHFAVKNAGSLGKSRVESLYEWRGVVRKIYGVRGLTHRERWARRPFKSSTERKFEIAQMSFEYEQTTKEKTQTCSDRNIFVLLVF